MPVFKTSAFSTYKPTRLGIALTVLLSLFQLTACSYLTPYKTPVTQGTVISEESMNLIQAGLTKQQVRSLLGPPLGQNPFNPNHWEYSFSTTDENFKATSAGQVIIQFDSDEMVESWQIKKN